MTAPFGAPAPFRLRSFLSKAALILSLAGAAGGLAHASATGGAGPLASAERARPLLEAIRGRVAPSPAVQKVLVWRGADLDGDGAADFVNPTGQAPRAHDAYGNGAFGASRDGGSRRHEGVDYVARAGQSVVAPISGYVTRIGFAYAGDTDLKFVEVTNPALGFTARVFYVDPLVGVGQAVRLGQMLGRAHSLQATYPGGMTDHVHLELSGPDQRRIDAASVLTARYEARPTTG